MWWGLLFGLVGCFWCELLRSLNWVSRAFDNVSLLPVTSKQFADPALLWTPTTTLQLQDRYLPPKSYRGWLLRRRFFKLQFSCPPLQITSALLWATDSPLFAHVFQTHIYHFPFLQCSQLHLYFKFQPLPLIFFCPFTSFSITF